MAQLKKRNKGSGSSGAAQASGAPSPTDALKPVALNTPFKAARAQLLEVVKPKQPEAKPVPVPVKKPPPRTVSEYEAELGKLSDEELFRQEMFGVQRMGEQAKKTGREQPIEQERAVVARQSEDAEAYAALSDLVEGTGPFDITDTDEYIEGIAPGLDRRLLQRLRRGDYAVQGHVDLHGLTREEARFKVEQFLHESRLNGRRCVLIVHGRGLNSKDQIPVLKEALFHWLQRGKIGRSVLCFATARPTDGGGGAVYVLLRR